MVDRVGQYIDDYRLVRHLGTGSFGEVYLGEQVQDYSPAAVKLLLLKQEDLQGGLEGFIKEASTAFRLKHPHIVQVLSFSVTPDHTPYLVMNYASNGTLRERHPKGTRLPLEIVISYLQPLASALQHAHDRRVVHRDVKPENVLIGPDGEIWLSDFGIAVTAPIERSLSTQGPGGTLPYMAPEQLSGKPQPASDQYALGIMVYEWLCGVRPFQGNQLEIVGQHISSPPPPLREKRPDLSSQVDAIVLRALAKDPKDRFSGVQTFANALAQAAGLDPAQAVSSVSAPKIEQFTPTMPTPPPVLQPPTSLHPSEHSETVVPLPPILSRRKRNTPATMTVLAFLALFILSSGGLTFYYTSIGHLPWSTTGNGTTTAQAHNNATATPLPAGTITDFPLRASPGPPEGITTGPDGNLWFLEGDAIRVGRITPGGTVTEFSVPSAPDGYTGTGGIIVGPDGNLWFTEFLSNKIGRITLTGKVIEFPLPSSGQGPGAITLGPDGNLWFTHSSGIIGYLTPDGQFTNFHVDSAPGGIVAGPDGNLWFTEWGQIGRITPTGKITKFPLPTQSFPGAITVGPDDNLWFTEWGQIGRITPTGKITEFPVPIASSKFTLPIAGIVAGPDGNLWFTERDVNQIGRITPTGKITEFPAPNAGANGPQDITIGPDRNLWFTEDDKIGRITTGR